MQAEAVKAWVTLMFAAFFLPCDSITAYALAHKDTIRQIENGREDKSHQRWDKQLDKQTRHIHRAEIQCISLIFRQPSSSREWNGV